MINANKIHHDGEGRMSVHNVNTHLPHTAQCHDLKDQNMYSNLPDPTTPTQTSQIRSCTGD
jgi:hypothetical protein